MNNYVQKGHTLTLVSANAVASGAGLLVGKLFGVAVTNVAAGGTGEFDTVGVFDLTALAADTAAVGDVLYWDATNNRLTTTATDNTRVGVAIEAKAGGATTARIRLDGIVA